jgi:hypothetical protein
MKIKYTLEDIKKEYLDSDYDGLEEFLYKVKHCSSQLVKSHLWQQLKIIWEAEKSKLTNLNL